MNIPQQIIGGAVIAIGLLIIFAPRRVTNAIFHPHYSCCGKCERTWDVVDPHTTAFEWSRPGEMHMFSGEFVPASSIFGDNIPEDIKAFIAVRQATRGCFPLCKGCWVKLGTPEARLPYYRRLIDEWVEQDRPQDESSELKWPAIRAAVMAGG